MTEIKTYRILPITLLAIAVGFAAIPAQAQFNILDNLGTTSTDPANPSGSFTQGPDGALYGTTSGGGTSDIGTVFRMTPAGKITVLYSFCALANCADGGQPAGLTLRPDGHFIGAALVGGTGTGFGTLFDISPTGSLTVLYAFNGGLDGRSPSPPVYTNGAFYGTANSGGYPSNCGTIYRMVNPGPGFHVIHRFSKTDGCFPTGLILGTDGNLYGTTMNGGTSGGGVVYSISPKTGVVTVLHSFNGSTDGSIPFGTLVQASDGNFYGTTKTSTFGTFGSTIYKITPAGVFNVLYQLSEPTGGSDGDFIQAGLVQATDGNFYGVASQGGSSCDECGTLFEVTSSGNFSVLYDFAIATGFNPASALAQHTGGLLYGNALYGGTGAIQACIQFNGCGILYSWNGNLPPFVSTVELMGTVGTSVEILGQGFTSTSTVSFNGVPATAKFQSSTYIAATVPAGATTGLVTVTTSAGTLTSNRQFIVTP